MDSAEANTLFVNMMGPSLEDPQEVNQAVIDAFKTQEDVKMYIRLLDYDDFRGFDLPSETDLAAISK